MTDCPPPTRGASTSDTQTFFDHSWCSSLTNIREFTVDCTDAGLPPLGGFHITSTGFCNDNEVCITDGDPTTGDSVAICSPQEPKLQLLEATRSSNLRRVTSRITSAGGSGTGAIAFSLTLAGQHDDLVFLASEISIAPRDKDYNLMAAPIMCQRCGRLSLKSPPNPNNFGINITLPHEHDQAILHDFAFAS